MPPPKGMKHVKTAGNIRGRHSCTSSTGKSTSFLERRRILAEMKRLVDYNVDYLRSIAENVKERIVKKNDETT